jgi:hypothetical protein
MYCSALFGIKSIFYRPMAMGNGSSESTIDSDNEYPTH